MSKKQIEDCHGYEIHGLAEAKTKKEKRTAIKRHLQWHEDRVSEISNGLRELEKQMKL